MELEIVDEAQGKRPEGAVLSLLPSPSASSSAGRLSGKTRTAWAAGMLPGIIGTGLVGARVGCLSLEDSVFLAKAVPPFQSGVSQPGFA